jgi:hypothetical protein
MRTEEFERDIVAGYAATSKEEIRPYIGSSATLSLSILVVSAS